MIPSLSIAMYFGENDAVAFLIAVVITLLFGVSTYVLSPKRGVVRYREGFLIVGVGWFLISAFGALPFLIYGTFDSFIDAYFEAVSGFTTTGSTVIRNIEIQPHGILFWRALTHWLGGMGVLVLTLAILPVFGMGSFQIFKSESPGPMPSKLVSRVGKTARLLYLIYFVLTSIEVVGLRLTGLSWFDSITHAFATMGTGGLSTKNASIGAFSNPSAEWLITFFMFIASVNFSLYYEVVIGGIKSLWRDSEFKTFVAIVLVAVLIVTLNIGHLHTSVWERVRYASFQVTSIISTTGFVTCDYEQWPELSQGILFLLMAVGACAGSTGGGIKVIRFLLVFKYLKRTLYRLIHPQAVIPVRVGGKPVPDEVLQNTLGFMLIYGIIIVLFSLLLLTQNMNLLSSVSAVVACLGNIGPGFGMVGPTTTYADLTDIAKILLSLAMILGRLEIYTVLVMLIPAFWRL